MKTIRGTIGLGIVMGVIGGCATTPHDSLAGAVALGDVRAAEHRLMAGDDPDAPAFPQGRTPLQIAVRNGNYQVARLLVEHGADVNAADWNGNTPLHDAVRANYLDIAQLLLEHGADLHARMYYVPPGVSARTEVERVPPLTYCAKRGYTNMADILRAHGARPSEGIW